jgi:hypothetical protein
MSASILALLAAFSFALGTVLQQRGTLQTSAAEGDPRFLGEIIRKPVWLMGGSLQILGWVLQAVALSLVFALPLGARITNQQVGRRSIIGACITLVGIISFVALGQPQGGTSEPTATAWWTSGLIIGGLMLLLGKLAYQRHGAVAAALFATAAGLSYAFQAAVTKVFMSQLGYGVAALLSSWTTYALILSALAGFALQQSALKTGFLAPAMAASNASTLTMSVLLGVTLFGESISNGQGRMLPAVISLALAVFGVILLASPEPGQPDIATQ